MSWIAIIERAAYTRFCKTGSLEPFHLKWPDLVALAKEVAELPPETWPLLEAEKAAGHDVAVRIEVPAESISRGVRVPVDEWV